MARFRAGILRKEALMEWNNSIPRTVGIGIQDFAKVVTNNSDPGGQPEAQDSDGRAVAGKDFPYPA